MKTLNVTASHQFAMEMTRAALPVVAPDERTIHGIWAQADVRVNPERLMGRTGVLDIYFNCGLKVRVAFRIFRNRRRKVWDQAALRVTLPDLTIWNIHGKLDEFGVIRIDERSRRRLT